MSAALQLPAIWGASQAHPLWRGKSGPGKPQRGVSEQPIGDAPAPAVNLGFYRKHTESLMRRYLYASMQIGRAPLILGDPVSRGWASSRPIRTFEDAVIFVLDVERCLDRLDTLDRKLLSRIVLQEYTQAEAAPLLGMSVRTVSTRFLVAVDRLTELLLEAGLLILPR